MTRLPNSTMLAIMAAGEEEEAEEVLTFRVDSSSGSWTGGGGGSSDLPGVSYSDMSNLFGDDSLECVDPTERFTAIWYFSDSEGGEYHIYDWNERISLWENRGNKATLKVVSSPNGDIDKFMDWLQGQLGGGK